MFYRKFLKERTINIQAMKNTLAALWRLVKGVYIKDLNQNLFLFQFFHERDVDRVYAGSPWTFDRHLLTTKRLEKGVSPSTVTLFDMHIWVQIYDLPSELLSEQSIVDNGNFIGSFLEADPTNFDGMWKLYLRVKVALDVRKPLRRKMKIKEQGENGFG